MLFMQACQWSHTMILPAAQNQTLCMLVGEPEFIVYALCCCYLHDCERVPIVKVFLFGQTLLAIF